MQHRVVSEYVQNSDSTNVKVYVRARPVDDQHESDFIQIGGDGRQISIKDPVASSRKHTEVSFQFDNIFWTDASQESVFENMVKNQVDHILNGFNCCCCAYGQTGSGKTYSMFGESGDLRGLIPRSVEYLFTNLKRISATSEVATVCSFLEIYNDQIRDLGKAYLVAMGAENSDSTALFGKTSDISESLAGKRGNPYFTPAFDRSKNPLSSKEVANRPGLKEVQDEYNTMNYEIREDAEGNVFVKDLSIVPVATLAEVLSLISTGLGLRATHEMKLNANSSRSHTVFTITVVQKDRASGQAITGMLNLVDLAGSERLKKSESQGMRLKEALHINSSLSALGKVVMSLEATSEPSHVPYRDSKLTRILQKSLGGNSYTTILAAIHPLPDFYDECLSTLQFANRCRNVRNNPRVNYIGDDEDKERKIKRLQEEITALRSKVNHMESTMHNSPTAASRMSPQKLVTILQKVGIAAVISTDGTLAVNGKKVANEDLGLGFGNESAVSEGSQPPQLMLGMGDFSRPTSAKSGKSVEKLKEQVSELKEENAKLQGKNKALKVSMESQGKELRDLANELFRCQTAVKHKETQFEDTLQERHKEKTDVEAKLVQAHTNTVKQMLDHNRQLLDEQVKVISKAPVAFRAIADLAKAQAEEKRRFEVPLRAEFESHLAALEAARVEELANVKKQYDHWLAEKDATLARFTDEFNRYRSKKSEQLRLCENEIVKLYEYTERIDAILDQVEKGQYRMQQLQGRSGRPTTGMVTNIMTGGVEGAMEETGSSTAHIVGKLLIPRGSRPMNPFSEDESGLGHLELTKRLVQRHRDRITKVQEAKEEAFIKSLQHMAVAGGSIQGTIATEMENKVRELLAQQPSTRGNGATSRPQSGVARSAPKGEEAKPIPPIRPPHSVLSRFRPKSGSSTSAGRRTTSGEQSLSQSVSRPSPVGSARVAVESSRENGNWQSSLDKTTFREAEALEAEPATETAEEIIYLRARVEELEQQRQAEQFQIEEITRLLQSDETVKYIRQLEKERESLHSNLKETSAQLQSAKIANAAMIRKYERR